MSGNLANAGPTLIWMGAIGLMICLGAKAADVLESWRRKRRTARVLRKYDEYTHRR